MRGKQTINQMLSAHLGITPACAGKPKCGRQTAGLMWDHPRACGENTLKYCLALAKSGSPPRVRGKQDASGQEALYARITPACAGKTQCGAHGQLGGQDHPRVCGEN